MASEDNLALPKGSLVMVTGANGFIGSHVCDQLLLAGYKVRGTVRSLKHAAWVEPYFISKYGEGQFSIVEVPEMSAAHAYDDAIQGCAGVIQVATPVMQAFDPNVGVPTVVDGVLNALRAAESVGVKRFVMTSSSTAAASPQPNKIFTIDSKTWNEEAVKAAWAPPPYEGLQRRLDVYSASKTQSEQAAWKFMREEKPGFSLNAVLPNMNIGKILHEDQGFPSTTGWIRALWDGFEGHEDLAYNPPQYYVNVQDNARVHVGALIYSDVNSERLFSFAHPYNWNDILAVLRKLHPEHKFINDIPNLGHDLSKVENERAEEIVKRFGRPGWTSLEDSIRDVTESFAGKAQA